MNFTLNQDNNNHADNFLSKISFHIYEYCYPMWQTPWQITLQNLLQNLLNIFSDESLQERGERFELQVRASKRINVPSLFLNLIVLKGTGKGKNYLLSEVWESFRELCGLEVSNYAVHKAMNQNKVTEFAQSLTQDVLAATYQLAEFIEPVGQYGLFRNLLRENGISHIINVDGVESRVIPRSSLEFDCKGTGKKAKPQQRNGSNNKNKSNGNCSIKLHLFQDPLTLCLLGTYITRGTFSERSILLDFIRSTSVRKSLFTCDRGYYSNEVSQEIVKHGHEFLLRLKKSHAYEILNAYDNNGSPILLEQGKLKELNAVALTYPEQILDLDVLVPATDDIPEHTMRVVISGTVTEESESVQAEGTTQPEEIELIQSRRFLATSLSRKDFCASAVNDLYNLRWSIENNAAKQLQSSNALQTINSGKLNLILQSAFASLISFSIKAATFALGSGILCGRIVDSPEDNLILNDKYDHATTIQESAAICLSQSLCANPIVDEDTKQDICKAGNELLEQGLSFQKVQNQHELFKSFFRGMKPFLKTFRRLINRLKTSKLSVKHFANRNDFRLIMAAIITNQVYERWGYTYHQPGSMKIPAIELIKRRFHPIRRLILRGCHIWPKRALQTVQPAAWRAVSTAKRLML